MHMWRIKVKMRGKQETSEQPAMMKSTEPNKNDVIEDLIVDGRIIRCKIISVDKAASGRNGYDVTAKEIE